MTYRRLSLSTVSEVNEITHSRALELDKARLSQWS